MNRQCTGDRSQVPIFRSAVLGAIISHRQHSADGFTLVVWGGLFKPRSRMILSLEMARPTSVITAHKWWPRICSTIPCNNGSAEIQISSKHGVLPVKKNNDGSKCWAEIIKKKSISQVYTRGPSIFFYLYTTGDPMTFPELELFVTLPLERRS